MIRRACLTGSVILLTAAMGLAADVDGRWEGTINGPDGDFKIGFNFKADGAKLTGTVESPNGDIEISDGKVEGDQISFKTKFEDNDVTHHGTISGDTIQLKIEGPWGEMEMTLNRVKEQKTSLRRAPSQTSFKAA
jgi:hypothetical protein